MTAPIRPPHTELDGTHAGRTLGCPRCGAPVAMVNLSRSSVLCAHCGCEVGIPGQLQREALAYQDQVKPELERFLDHREAIEEARNWTNPTGRRVKIGIFAVMILWWIPSITTIADWLGSDQSLRSDAALPLVSLGVAILFGIVGLGAPHSGDARTDRQPPIAGVVECPGCGARHAISAQQALGHCSFCGVAIVPSAAMFGAMLDAARVELRRVELLRYRTERRQRQKMAEEPSSGGRWIVLALIGYVGPLIVALVRLTLSPGDAFEARMGELICGALAFAVVAITVSVMLRRAIWRARAQRFVSAVACLDRQLQGRAGCDVASLVDWLNAYWCAPYPLWHLALPRCHHHIVGHAHGYPVLVDISSYPYAAGYEPRVEVLLAMDWPPHRVELTGPDSDAIARFGFQLEATQAGLVARAAPGTVSAFNRAPQTLTMLPRVAVHLARLAASVGAQPAQPIAEHDVD